MAERRHSVPDWLLERLVAGELPEPVADELRSRLTADAELDRLAALELSNRSILSAHTPATVAAEVQRRSQAARPRVSTARASRFALPALALSGTAALVLALTVLPRSRLEGGADTARRDPAGAAAAEERVTAKGLAPQLAVYAQTASGAKRLSRGDRAHAGDTLQLAYVAASARYGVIASVDGEGTVTLHLPEQAGLATRLNEASETALPHAFELDGATGFEHFVFVTSDAPFSTSDVEAPT